MEQSAHKTDEILSIEQRGIDIVQGAERHGRPMDLFWMWFGTNLNIFYVVNGAVVISLGLSFAQSVLVIVLGNLAFFTVGLTSLQGPRTGTSTFAISRAPFGPRGGQGLSLFNWLTCVGFEASGLALIALAVLELFAKAGVGSSTGLKIGVILVAAVVQGLLPLYGHATIMVAQRFLGWIFAVLFIVMAVLIIPKVHLGTLARGGGWGTIMVGIALVISAGGLSWANTGSDYSRYLPADSSPKQIFWWSSLGGFVPGLLLEVLGAAVASVVASASNPIAGLPTALPGWFVVPYLFFAVLTLLAVNTIDLYSSGLTLQALGLRIDRWKCVLLDSVICTAITFFVVFSSSFNHYYSDFLGLLIVWLAPWTGIYLVDWMLRRGRYDAAALVDTRGGRYWRRGGVHLPGVVAQVIGMVASAMWINSSAFVGPLSSRADGSDFSVFMGVGFGALAYVVLAWRSVRREGRELADEPGVALAAPSGARSVIEALHGSEGAPAPSA